MENLVLYEVKERVAYITLNRPEKRNALSFEMVTEIKSVYKNALDDSNCKVIVIKANGGTFCSGADLSSLQKLQNNTHEENLNDSKNLAELFKLIYTSSKVTISQVEGFALAGGCGLASVCDFCFASENSTFAYTEVKIGFVPAIVMVFLVRKIGEKNSKEILLTGESLNAEEAKNYNLINTVCSKELIDETVFNFATQLCKNTSAQSLTLTKQMINEIQNKSLDDALDYASEMNAFARKTEDCKKGVSAFLNKEKFSW